jgi:hypothetical protein
MRGFYLVLLSQLVERAALSGWEELIDERRISSLVPILITNTTMIPVHGDSSRGFRYAFDVDRYVNGLRVSLRETTERCLPTKILPKHPLARVFSYHS